jgi:Flp pilus assembly pilin Flp
VAATGELARSGSENRVSTYWWRLCERSRASPSPARQPRDWPLPLDHPHDRFRVAGLAPFIQETGVGELRADPAQAHGLVAIFSSLCCALDASLHATAEGGNCGVWGPKVLRNRLSDDQCGASLIEYALLVSLVVLTLLVVIIAVSSWTNDLWAPILR